MEKANAKCTFDRAQYLTGQPVRVTLCEAPESLDVRLFRLAKEVPFACVTEGNELVLNGLPEDSYGILITGPDFRWEGAFDVVSTRRAASGTASCQISARMTTTRTLFCGGIACFQIISRVELSFGSLLKNTFTLLFTRPKLMGGWLLLSAGLFAAGLLLLPHSLPYVLLLEFSLPCMAGARGLLPAIENEMIKE